VQLRCIDPASSKLSHVATHFLVTGSLFVVAFGRGKAKPPGRGYNMANVQDVLEEIRQEKVNQARLVLQRMSQASPNLQSGDAWAPSAVFALAGYWC
jgi:hypothetical protein